MDTTQWSISLHLRWAVAEPETTHAAVALALETIVAHIVPAFQASSPKTFKPALAPAFFRQSCHQ
ncbi:hypothetical protein [Novosphingobium kaempferiae]|uniref:hypothetical protein n=1 Tax=Novosphingobium kaempferiae TaxID=2896849 RepID=UPI001E632CC3|nr:hypothetical protein [Novosphingobium kaempferiae]